MSDDDKINMRLECLHISSRSCGEDVDPEDVLQAAKDYYEWVLGNGKKAELRVVKSQEDDGA